MKMITLLLVGAITRYNGPIHAPLKCGGTYNEGHRWIAMADPRFQCGEWVIVQIDGYTPFVAQVKDSGGFADHCVMQPDGSCAPIIGDLPTHAAPFAPDLSAIGSISHWRDDMPMLVP